VQPKKGIALHFQEHTPYLKPMKLHTSTIILPALHPAAIFNRQHFHHTPLGAPTVATPDINPNEIIVSPIGHQRNEDDDILPVHDDPSVGSDASSRHLVPRQKAPPDVLSKREGSRVTSGSTHSTSRADCLSLKRSKPTSGIFNVLGQEHHPLEPAQRTIWMKEEFAVALFLAGGIQKSTTATSKFLPVFDLATSDAFSNEQRPVLCGVHPELGKTCMTRLFPSNMHTHRGSLYVDPLEQSLPPRQKCTIPILPPPQSISGSCGSEQESQYDETDWQKVEMARCKANSNCKRALRFTKNVDQTKLDAFAQLPETAVSPYAQLKTEFKPEHNPFIDTEALEKNSDWDTGDKNNDFMIPVKICGSEDSEDDDDDNDDNDKADHSPPVEEQSAPEDKDDSPIEHDSHVPASSIMSWISQAPSLEEARRANKIIDDQRILPPQDIVYQQIKQSNYVIVTRRSMYLLRPRAWLNDEIIHFFAELLMEQDAEMCQSVNSGKRSHIFNSFLMTKACQEGSKDSGEYCYNLIEGWSKKVPGKSTTCQPLSLPIILLTSPLSL
jgi:hypothetical protein